nr:neuroligin-4, X-linked-like [Halyomorpha halys]
MWRLLTALLYLAVLTLGHKYSTRLVRTKYGPLRGLTAGHPPVEAFLGVPYATPPVGSLRYMPPVTPSMWRSPRLADTFSPVCPQAGPHVGNLTEALLELPRGRVAYLEKLLPLLANQSEDCLYLNIYVPRGAGGVEHHELPVILYVHGESFEWNSGNPYDGSVLASYGHLIVVTINFRLGILGFLKTGARGSAQGNFGLMDLVAGLHWLKENIPAFGGDPERITLMGHGTGAALANFIAVSPVAKDLLHRVILVSGSGLSPWALQREPLAVKRRVAEQTGCHGDLVEDDLAPCLRTKPLSDLLAVKLEPPRFTPGFAPFPDGAVLSTALSEHHGPGHLLAEFPARDLLFGLVSTESYLDLSAQDLEYGFNETRRDRILRTFVRNSYFFHLNEIFSTLKNEYTDWERPTQNPLSVRDATLEVLSDGHTVSPLIRLGHLHSASGGRTYFMHFQHLSSEGDYPQRTGSVRGEDIPYALGLPLTGGLPHFPQNYTAEDITVSKRFIHYLANFARKGDPNGPIQSHGETDKKLPFWDTYDSINQLYLQLGVEAEVKNHYRGHKMSLWLNLIPQLHQPGLEELSMRHHHFQEEGAQYYDGSVRPQSLQRPPVATPPPTTTTSTTTTSTTSRPEVEQTSTDCPPNSTVGPAARPATNSNSLLRKLASSHYQSYTTALTVTIAVGCFLLLLNILIFAGIYHQRDRRERGNKKKEEAAEQESPDDGKQPVELQEFKCSPGSARGFPPVYDCEAVASPSIPEPPPPPKAQPPQSASGILRPSTPNTPSLMKKRLLQV